MNNKIYYLCHKNSRPTSISEQPIMKSQPESGSNITSKTPKPNPIKQVASSFFSILPINFNLPPFIHYM